MMRYINSKGFTLIELMITVAIISILAAIAVPAYNAQVQKTRRSDGIALMLQIAQQQERYYSKNFLYADSVTDLGYSATPTSSAKGHYEVSTSSAACSAGVVASCFTVSAVAVNAQLDDTNCRTFTINEAGSRLAKDSGNADSTATCY